MENASEEHISLRKKYVGIKKIVRWNSRSVFKLKTNWNFQFTSYSATSRTQSKLNSLLTLFSSGAGLQPQVASESLRGRRLPHPCSTRIVFSSARDPRRTAEKRRWTDARPQLEEYICSLSSAELKSSHMNSGRNLHKPTGISLNSHQHTQLTISIFSTSSHSSNALPRVPTKTDRKTANWEVTFAAPSTGWGSAGVWLLIMRNVIDTVWRQTHTAFN